MDLIDALRTTGAVREFLPRTVADEVIAAVLDTARFAPSGGNRQAWRVVVVKDPATRAAVRDLYTSAWYQYLAQSADGLTPWAPITDRQAEQRALTRADEIAATSDPAGFAERLDHVPAMLVVLADLRCLATVDRDLDRYGLAGGASVYPFVWSILLAARAEGLRGVITTMAIHREPELKQLLDVPAEFAVAAVVVLGYPVSEPSRLRRSAASQFATIDRFSGPNL